MRAAGAYEGALREALLAYKERGRRDLAGVLGRLLASVVLALGLPAGRPILLVPAPSARRAAAARGGDHMARLARRAAGWSGARAGPGVLRVSRGVADSAGLGVAQRARNLRGAFVARRGDQSGCYVAVVVDDVVTSGATLREAHRALRAAGWPVAGAAVLAATPRRHPPGRGVPFDALAPPSQPV